MLSLISCHSIFIVGHNIAATQTVLWSRILDRLAGPDPPKIVVMDPRSTSTAQTATVHIAPNIGTNVAVLNGLLRLLFEEVEGSVDEDYVKEHTVGVRWFFIGTRHMSADTISRWTGFAIPWLTTLPSELRNSAVSRLQRSEQLQRSSGSRRGY
jgi:ferredoxin-nitrate reductase